MDACRIKSFAATLVVSRRRRHAEVNSVVMQAFDLPGVALIATGLAAGYRDIECQAVMQQSNILCYRGGL